MNSIEKLFQNNQIKKMENYNVYCIIVTYNALKWIDKCISSLMNSTLRINIVVVDNCSKDETISYINNHFPEVHIISNPENHGFGGANNQGIVYAYQKGATHFILLNQDAWVHSDTIEKLVKIQSSQNLDLVSPIHLNGRGDSMDGEFYRKFICNDAGNEIISNSLLGRNVEYYYSQKTIPAAAWSLTRKTIEDIGGFDPLFFHYGEDSNYIQRLLYHKKKIAVNPNCFINHDRIYHGNVKVFNKQSTLSGLLSIYLDINKRPLSDYICCHIKNLVKFFLFFFSFRFNRCYYVIKAYFCFMRRIGKICQSKRNNKIMQSNWLNLAF